MIVGALTLLLRLEPTGPVLYARFSSDSALCKATKTSGGRTQLKGWVIWKECLRALWLVPSPLLSVSWLPWWAPGPWFTLTQHSSLSWLPWWAPKPCFTLTQCSALSWLPWWAPGPRFTLTQRAALSMMQHQQSQGPGATWKLPELMLSGPSLSYEKPNKSFATFAKSLDIKKQWHRTLDTRREQRKSQTKEPFQHRTTKIRQGKDSGEM